MEYLLLLHANENGWENLSPADQERGMAAYVAYTEALRQAGAFGHQVGASISLVGLSAVTNITANGNSAITTMGDRQIQ